MSNHSHTLNLVAEPYEAIASGRKTIELRLHDEKRQSIQIGDTIVFHNRSNEDSMLHTEVIGLLRFDRFADLLKVTGSAACGYESEPELLVALRQFYSEEDEVRHGVLGIVLRRI